MMKNQTPKNIDENMIYTKEGQRDAEGYNVDKNKTRCYETSVIYSFYCLHYRPILIKTLV